MRKFLIAVLIPASAVSTEITDTISVYREVIPDTYRMSVKITCKAKKEKKVIECLSAVDKTIGKLKLPYTGGNYLLYPQREWSPAKKTYVSKGFKGIVYYNFQLKKPENQDKVLTLLNKVQEKLPVSYSISNVGWSVSPSKRRKIEQELKLILLGETRKEAKKFGKALNKRCSVESIRFEREFYFYPKMESFTVRAPIPKRSKNTFTVKASVKFNCK